VKLLGAGSSRSSYIDLIGLYMVKIIGGTVAKTFHKIDINGNGVISKVELRVVLQKLGVHRDVLERDVDKLIEVVDTEGDGVISLAEFHKWYMTQKARATSRIEKLFTVFDEDNDGFIDQKEFRALLTAVNGSKAPTELLDVCPERINLTDTVAWFESQNPIDKEGIFKKRRISGIRKSSVLPIRSTRSSTYVRSRTFSSYFDGDSSIAENCTTGERSPADSGENDS